MDVRSFGVLGFQEAERLQLAVHADVLQGKCSEAVLWGEHPPVLTAGKHADTAGAMLNADGLASLGFQLVTTDRGGQVTLHDRGQLVVYPILRISERSLSVRRYIQLLEECVIATLAKWGIRGGRVQEYPGVWVGNKKIAAVGVRISQRVSRHGVSINVHNDLRPYGMMIPCGIVDRGVTSMAECMPGQAAPDVNEVAREFVNCFQSLFAKG